MNEAWPPRCLELFARHLKHAQAGAADELQLGQVEHEIFDRTGQHGRELALQFGRGGGVETAGEFYGDGASVLGADALLDLDFEWHISFAF